MEFKLTAKVEKNIFKGEYGEIFIVKESRRSREGEEYEVPWKIQTKSSLEIGSIYDFEGFVTETQDKNLKDEKGYPVRRTNFKATKAIQSFGF